MDSTTFTTLKSNMGAILAAEGGATPSAPTAPSGALEILTSPDKTPQQRNIIIVAIAAVIGIIAYFGYFAQSGGKSGGKQRRR